MQLLQAFILGLVQGLTEFIPVSSSGHLILFDHWLGFKGGLTFDIALNIGTLIALYLFFWRDFYQLITGIFRPGKDRRLALLIILGTIPAVIAGVFLESYAETAFRSVRLVAINLMIVAVLMLVVDKFAKRNLTIDDATPKKALLVGLAQAIALVPGVSRSGITIVAGLSAGFDRVAATRFSFLLSGPIILGATLKVLADGESLSQVAMQPALFIVGIVASFISGYFAIGFLLKYLARRGLAVFAYYRLALGAIILLTGVGI